MTRVPPTSSGGVKIVATSVTFMTFSILAVALRVIAARMRHRPFRLHDYLSFAALVFALGFGADALVGVYRGGSGQHVEDIITDQNQGPSTLTIGLKNFFASALVWAFATCFCKMSILFLYIDLFPKRPFRRAVYITMGFVVAFGLSLILTGLLICKPIEFNWDKSLDGRCGSTVGEEIAFAAVNMVIDGVIVFLPTPVIWRLQMPVRKKIGVSCMFGLGLVICVMNAARIGVVVNSDEADFTHALTDVAILSGLEVWFGIIAACLPTLKPIFRRRGGHLHDIPSSGHWGRDCRRGPSNKLYPSDCGASRELGSTYQRGRVNQPSVTHLDPFNNDDQPLTGGLTFPTKAKKARAMLNPWSHSTKSLPDRGTTTDMHDVRIDTDISISSTVALRA
ncbi:MAG: hypothetical protein Q9173_002664 [Seirophora scorigena]